MGMKRVFGDWTGLERDFLAAWKATFGGNHDDWHSEAWDAGTSSLLKWFDWLGGYPPKRLLVLVDVMERFRAESDPRWPRLPSLYDFRRQYEAMSGRVRRTVPEVVRDRQPLSPEQASALLREAFPEAFVAELLAGKRAVTQRTEQERRELGLEPEMASGGRG